ncbi:SpoIIIAH-like family protein [Paenibacillus gorillae]|uniref:SpoIIIAH-like family protein n=1 Tax=Paenibacillus gorillae TaxID=1243662 RepID=UPI0004B41E68|nr:SpoIIIAH-like family protein [Paenibacillus gorillae]
MNTKRQTIWLVSMLSLMVVLSAYYLFTQDGKSPDLVTDGSQTQQKGGEATEVAKGDNGIIINEVDGGAKTDKEVIEQLENGGGAVASVFAEVQEKRQKQFNEEEDKIYAAISNTQNNPEESTEAAKALNMLEEKREKLNTIESELMKQFHTAIVDDQNDRYKVVVESEKLDKAQAVGIIDLVIKTMDVKADQVTVQFVP